MEKIGALTLFISEPRYNHINAVEFIFLLTASVLSIVVSCEDPLDYKENKESNDLFELTFKA